MNRSAMKIELYHFSIVGFNCTSTCLNQTSNCVGTGGTRTACCAWRGARAVGGWRRAPTTGPWRCWARRWAGTGETVLRDVTVTGVQAAAVASGGRTIQTFMIGLPWFAWFGLCKPMANQIDQNPNHFVMRTSRIQTNSLTSKPIYLNQKPACKPILCHPNQNANQC